MTKIPHPQFITKPQNLLQLTKQKLIFFFLKKVNKQKPSGIKKILQRDNRVFSLLCFFWF